MVKQITGYKWQTQQAAINAQNAAKGHYLSNRPNIDGKPFVTTEYFVAVQNVGSEGNFWYFEGDISPVLGVPQTFTVNIPDIEI